MTKSKYLYQSLLFSSINSNNFCDMFSCKNDKNKKLQINEQKQDQEQNPPQTPVQNSNQQEEKKQQLITECNDLIAKIKKLDSKFNKTVYVKKTYEELTNFKNELENDLKALEEKEKEKKNKDKKPEDPKKTNEKLVQSEKVNNIANINNIKETLKKTYNNVECWDLENNCCIYYCRFNEGDKTRKTDAKGNKVKKHFVYIYVSYLDNYKLIAESENDTSDREDLGDDILKIKNNLKFELLGFKSSKWDLVYFKLGTFKDILTKFLNLCDSECVLINKIQEPLIPISLYVYNHRGVNKDYENLWLGLINNNLYYETKSTKGKRLLIPMNDWVYERLNKSDYKKIYAYSNDYNEKKKKYFYRLKRVNYDKDNHSNIDIESAASDNFIIKGNNFENIYGKDGYALTIVNK